MNIEKQDFQYILEDKNIDFKKFSGKTVLVTGASGMLAAYMVKTLLYLNTTKKMTPVKLFCLVRNQKKAKEIFLDYKNDENLHFIEQDVKMPLLINDSIDYIIHAASSASGKFFYSDPVGVINANTLGTINMLNLAKEKKVKSFLFFSSGEACGDIFSRKDCVKESDYGIIDPYDIRNCYALSKKMGENICYSYYCQFGIPTKSVRPSHTYGPGFKRDDDRAFAQFVMNAVNQQDIVLNSDGSAKRSFVYIADATRAYFNVLLNGEDGNVYNVANSREISIRELAEIICKISNNKISVKFCENETNNSCSSIHGLQDICKIRALKWEPTITEEEGFKRTFEFYKYTKST